jgi:hypothetical protein
MARKNKVKKGGEADDYSFPEALPIYIIRGFSAHFFRPFSELFYSHEITSAYL